MAPSYSFTNSNESSLLTLLTYLVIGKFKERVDEGNREKFRTDTDFNFNFPFRSK